MSLQSYDNGDAQLDSSELLRFIQHNDSVVQLQSYADQESNKLLRSVWSTNPRAYVRVRGSVSVRTNAVCISFHALLNICSCDKT